MQKKAVIITKNDTCYVTNQDLNENSSFNCEIKSVSNDNQKFIVVKSKNNETAFFAIDNASEPSQEKIILNMNSYALDDLIFRFDDGNYKKVTDLDQKEQKVGPIPESGSFFYLIIALSPIGFVVLLIILVVFLKKRVGDRQENNEYAYWE